MSNHDNNIEERLIPYIEGVLAESEHQEVDKAIQADASLAREVDELRELIGDLRGAFASGLGNEVDGLSVEEVVQLAAHDGSLETMSGTPSQKARLFCSDQALEEYRLLRSLSEDMQQTTLPMIDVPSMPESMLAEIARYKSSSAPKVVQLAPKLTPKAPSVKSGFLGFMDRLDPKPLMATAAAFVLLSLGFHVYNTPATSTMSGDQQVAYSRSAATPATTPVSEVAVSNGKGVVEPTGVTVFTSGDRSLLKEQAEKLLAEKVRYTVTDDRILVSENEVAQARAVLWGDETATNVAMVGEKSPEEQFLTPRDAGDSDGDARAPKAGRQVTSEAPAGPEAEEFEAPPIDIIDLRRASKGVEQKSYSADKKSDRSDGLGEGSALQRKPGEGDEPNWSGSTSRREVGVSSVPPDIETGTMSASVAPEAAELKGASKSEREKILKSMALGQSGEVAPPTPRPVRVADDAKPVRQEISRARVGHSAEENRNAPVANVVTADAVLVEADKEDNDIVEESGGAVASRADEPRKSKVREAAERPSVVSTGRAQAGYAPGGTSDEGAVVESPGGDVDLRLAAVRSTQASVARRYDVVLSVEAVGSAISVYVRPNKELSKAEIDELRGAIRADLGLSASDTIVFR